MKNYFFNNLKKEDLNVNSETFLFEQKMNEYIFRLYALNKNRICIKIRKIRDKDNFSLHSKSNRKILYIDVYQDDYIDWTIQEINNEISNWIANEGIEDRIQNEKYRVTYYIRENGINTKYISKGFEDKDKASTFFEDCLKKAEVIVDYFEGLEKSENLCLEMNNNIFSYKFKDEDSNICEIKIYLKKHLIIT